MSEMLHHFCCHGNTSTQSKQKVYIQNQHDKELTQTINPTWHVRVKTKGLQGNSLVD